LALGWELAPGCPPMAVPEWGPEWGLPSGAARHCGKSKAYATEGGRSHGCPARNFASRLQLHHLWHSMSQSGRSTLGSAYNCACRMPCNWLQAQVHWPSGGQVRELVLRRGAERVRWRGYRPPSCTSKASAIAEGRFRGSRARNCASKPPPQRPWRSTSSWDRNTPGCACNCAYTTLCSRPPTMHAGLANSTG